MGRNSQLTPCTRHEKANLRQCVYVYVVFSSPRPAAVSKLSLTVLHGVTYSSTGNVVKLQANVPATLHHAVNMISQVSCVQGGRTAWAVPGFAAGAGSWGKAGCAAACQVQSQGVQHQLDKRAAAAH